MSSNINATNVDGAYPIAGQDNDSQGFRDNFTNIRTNLTFAKEEIEELQRKAVLKEALVSAPLDNNLTGVTFTGLNSKAFTEEQFAFGAVSGTNIIQFTNGQFQTLTTNGPVTLGFANWVSGVLCKIRVKVTASNVSDTLTVPAAVTIGKDEIIGFAGLVLTFPEIGDYIFEFTSNDGGTTVSIQELTDKLSTVQTHRRAPLAASGASGDKIGMIASDASFLYVCTATWVTPGSAIIWKKIALTAF